MTALPASFRDLALVLETVDPDLPVHFRTDEDDAGPGYHITEVMIADIRSIDCGGQQNAWREARLQLLDGQGGSPQSAGKMASILARSRAALPEVDDLPLTIEFGHDNASLSAYRLGPAALEDGRLTLSLSGGRAQCKAARRAPAAGEVSGCCGAGAAQGASACCA